MMRRAWGLVRGVQHGPPSSCIAAGIAARERRDHRVRPQRRLVVGRREAAVDDVDLRGMDRGLGGKTRHGARRWSRGSEASLSRKSVNHGIDRNHVGGPRAASKQRLRASANGAVYSPSLSRFGGAADRGPRDPRPPQTSPASRGRAQDFAGKRKRCGWSFPCIPE